jgi:NDP-sugar pyrophosphorylase family protein
MSDNPYGVEVIVLAAGRGERLRPQTDILPKPLLKVGDRTLLEWSLSGLQAAGFKSVWINVHHLPEAIPAFIGNGDRFGLQINYSREDQLLDTGGALANIQSIRDAANVLVLNADAFFADQIPFDALIERQQRSENCAATLLLKSHPEASKYGIIEADQNGQITTFIGNTVSAVAPTSVTKYIYTGCMVLGIAALSQLPPAGTICSLTRDLLVQSVKSGCTLNSIQYSGEWIDVGTPERLSEASKIVIKRAQR